MAESHHDHSHCSHAGGGEASKAGAVTDPVCGMSVDPATTPHVATHGGSHHYFCSAGCRAKFEADPARYTSDAPRPAQDVPKGAIWTCPMHPEIRRN
jgi:Cu+-exporting ATPase